MKPSTNTTKLVGLAAIGGLLVGAIATTSCIIPDTGVVFRCGRRWQGEADGARFQNQAGNPQTVATPDIQSQACMNPREDAAMADGVSANCHLIMSQGSCTGCCEWVELTVDSRSRDVCMYKNDAYQETFAKLAGAIADACETAVPGTGEAYPCDGLGQAACGEEANCTWTGSRCLHDFTDCMTAAIRTAPASIAGEAGRCNMTAAQCDSAAGTGDDGGATACEISETTGEESLPSPSSVITTINSTTWEIDEDFWAMITQPINQTLLLGQNARIVPMSGDWGLTNVTTNTYVYAMGLRTNDILWEINGYSLTGSLQDIEDALAATGGASAFTFKVKRGTVIRTHTYVIN